MPSLPSSVLVAGATGTLGRHVVRVLAREGVRVRILTRGGTMPESLKRFASSHVRGDLTDPDTLRGCCERVEGVFSCAGASLALDMRERRTFTAVDALGNIALLEEARRAGVRRMAYVSAYGAEELPWLEYARAHEQVVDALASSGIRATVVRPTGFYSVLAEMVRMAAKGRALVIGDGSARTNPVHEEDVAEWAVAAWGTEAREVAIGGPVTYTRAEIARLAVESVGRDVAIRHVAPDLLRAAAALISPIQPRLSALMAFGVAVSTRDVIAPALGRRPLPAYFADVAATVRALPLPAATSAA